MLRLHKNWRFMVGITVPFLLLPIAFCFGDSEEESLKFKCAYVVLLMGVFWLTEVLPIAVTALFPVVFFPLFGIQSSEEVAPNYMRETGMVFISTICLALGIQYSGLDKRIAFRTLILVGSSPWRLLLGIIVTSMSISCVVNGNALVAMLHPIVDSLIDNLDGFETIERKTQLRTLYMIAVCFAANIGGTAVMIGSNSNLIFNQLISLENIGQNGKYMDINFASWIGYNMPIAIINVILLWLVLGVMYLGIGRKSKTSSITTLSLSESELGISEMDEDSSADKLNGVMKKKMAELGNMSFHEKGILILYSIVVLLWLLRDPKIFSGWLSVFNHGLNIGEGSVAIAIVILMFLIPKELRYFKGDFSGPPETLMNWKYVHTHFPWNVILLVGGGLAISDGARVSGLSMWIGEQLNSLAALPNIVILLILLPFISLFTEIASNSASISIITPIVITLSKRLNIHPLYLSLPGAIATQYAFMLPTSNPSNAIIYTAGGMKMMDMIKPGIFVKAICLIVLFLMNISWGEYVIFNYRNYEYAPLGNVTS